VRMKKMCGCANMQMCRCANEKDEWMCKYADVQMIKN
jgi:hypothetical protein